MSDLEKPIQIPAPANTTHLNFLEAVPMPTADDMVNINPLYGVHIIYTDSSYFGRQCIKVMADTVPVTALLYGVTEDGDFGTLFSSLGNGWRLHMPTQGQIVDFCQMYPSKLNLDGYGTFFPFQIEGEDELFVAFAYLDLGARLIKILVRPLAYNVVWLAEHRHRLVILQE